jgi:MOSC domain-containing protein YiiM
MLLSVNVGLPKNVAWQDQTVYTGAWKHPVDGPAMVRQLNIVGDGQGDTNGHGGEQRGRPGLPDRVLPALAGVLRPG